MCRHCFIGCEFHRRRCPVRRPCVRQYKRCCPRIRPLFAAINGLTQPPERFKQSKSPQLACGVFFIFSPCFFAYVQGKSAPIGRLSTYRAFLSGNFTASHSTNCFCGLDTSMTRLTLPERIQQTSFGHCSLSGNVETKSGAVYKP